MTKTQSTPHPARAEKASPAGKAYVVELSEAQLRRAAGGLIGLLRTDPKP